MIEKKFEFYIDTALQEDFCNKKIFVKPFNLTDIDIYNGLNIEEHMAEVTEYKINTKNQILKDFCINNNINENLYNKIVRNFTEIYLIYYDVIHINSINPAAEYYTLKNFYKTFYETKKINDVPFIIKFEKKEYIFLDQLINYNENLVISHNILDNTKQEKLRYRLYLDERLLIERFFPENLDQNKVICEECFLDLKKPVKVKLATSKDLIVKRVVSNNGTFYPNSTEFILEP